MNKRQHLVEVYRRQGGIVLPCPGYHPERDYLGSPVIPALCRVYLRDFPTRWSREAVYFWGPQGTQKTTIASYLAWEVIGLPREGSGPFGVPKVYRAAVVNAQTFLQTLSSFQSVDSEPASCYRRRLMDLDLLVLDDFFDKAKMTIYASGFQLPFLDSFLRERLEGRRKAVIFTSNVPPEQIDEKVFGVSLKDLVLRNTVARKTVVAFSDNYADLFNREQVLGLFDAALQESGLSEAPPRGGARATEKGRRPR